MRRKKAPDTGDWVQPGQRVPSSSIPLIFLANWGMTAPQNAELIANVSVRVIGIHSSLK